MDLIKVDKTAMIRDRYNRIPHPAVDTMIFDMPKHEKTAKISTVAGYHVVHATLVFVLFFLLFSFLNNVRKTCLSIE